MSTIIKIKNGVMKTIYSDEAFEIFKSLGKAVVKRATHVDYDNVKEKWIAITADLGEDNIVEPGTVLAETEKKDEAINIELAFLRENL